MLRIYKENVYRVVTEEAYERKWKSQGFEICADKTEAIAENPKFEEMTYAELRKYASEHSISIPGNVTKKETILDILLKHSQEVAETQEAEKNDVE